MEEKLCYVCSPYRGDVARNVKYAQELTGRAVRRGLVPITPHLYITQALDDNDPAERALGMEAGLHLLEPCKYIMIGGRYGLSEGFAQPVRPLDLMAHTLRNAIAPADHDIFARFQQVQARFHPQGAFCRVVIVQGLR